ncbi:phage integrase N-terminal SAM-like domain-containing protein [Bacteroidota bacterium]
MSASVQSQQSTGPDGRQTRIDFFGRGKPSKSESHIVHTKKHNNDWWQALASWLKSSPKEQERKAEEFSEFLRRRNYSEKTCRSYLFMLRKFFEYLDQHHINEISIGVIEDYNYDFFVSGRYSRPYQLQFLNSIALYLEFAHGVRVNLKGLRRSVPKR